jgi:hypothetical protein
MMTSVEWETLPVWPSYDFELYPEYSTLGSYGEHSLGLYGELPWVPNSELPLEPWQPLPMWSYEPSVALYEMPSVALPLVPYSELPLEPWQPLPMLSYEPSMAPCECSNTRRLTQTMARPHSIGRAQTTHKILKILEILVSIEMPPSIGIPPFIEILPSIDIPAIHLSFARGFPLNTHRTCLFSYHVRDQNSCFAYSGSSEYIVINSTCSFDLFHKFNACTA